LASDTTRDRIIVLGKIAGPFGVQGWMKVASFTDPPDNILDYERWQVGSPGNWAEVKLEAGRMTGKGVLAKLAGVESPEAARTRVGQEIGVWRSELPPPAPGEYYWADLESFAVETPEAVPLGKVDHFRATPTGPVVIVRGEREYWIPFVKERIVKVDIAASRLVLDWPVDL